MTEKTNPEEITTYNAGIGNACDHMPPVPFIELTEAVRNEIGSRKCLNCDSAFQGFRSIVFLHLHSENTGRVYWWHAHKCCARSYEVINKLWKTPVNYVGNHVDN